MSLNIDLEDVPFAILEAVKARILANRRKLQDSRDQPLRRSTRPRPQFARIGATSKIWRLPKPAAMLEDEGTGMIITWNNGQPVVKEQNGTITEWYEFGSVPSTLDDLGGIPAVSVLPYFPGNDSSYGNIGLTARPYIETQYLSACTLEAWGELIGLGGGPVNSRYAVDIRMNWNYSDVPSLYADSFVFCAYDFTPSGLSNPLSIPPYERAPGNFLYCYSRPEAVPGQTPFNKEEVFISSSPPVGSFHVCIQIAGYQISYYLNGSLIRRYSLPNLNILTEKLQVSAFASSSRTLSIAKLSEIRLTTDQARYPLDGFTPDRPPFP